MKPQTFVLMAATWTLLALATLYQIIQNSNGYSIAGFAWVGGIVTAILYKAVYDSLKKRSVTHGRN